MMDLVLTQCEEKWVAMAEEDLEEEIAGEDAEAGEDVVDVDEDGGMEIEDGKMEGSFSSGSWGHN